MRQGCSLTLLLTALASAGCGRSPALPGLPSRAATLRARLDGRGGPLSSIAQLKSGPRDERAARIARAAESLWATTRMAAAAAAADLDPPAARPVLEKLLADPDVLVRRLAAQSLLGPSATQGAAARRHDYAEVLAAEARARDLLKRIRRADLAGQCQATQELIALGWPAFWELNQRIRDRSLTVALSATVAADEIDRSHKNAPPAWAQEIERKLDERKVSFDFNGLPLDEALRRLSKTAGVPIRLQGDSGDAEKVTLRVADMRLRAAISWLVKLACYRYALWDGAILVHPPERRHTFVTVLVDVRDLEARGIRPDWRLLLHSNVPDAAGAWAFDSRQGILLMDFYVNVEDGGKWEAAAIGGYLAELRELVKLDPERVRELELRDRDDPF